VSTLRLFINESHLHPGGPGEFDWRLLDGPSISRGRSRLAALPGARRFEVFLPPSLVLRTAITLPPGARRQARRLLSHALDTVLLADPDSQQLAYALDGERCRIAAIDRERLTSILTLVAQSGRRPNGVYAADMLLPTNGATLLWYDCGWARRMGEEAHWFDAASPYHCPTLLAAARGDAETWHLAVADGLADAIDLPDWQRSAGKPVSLAHGDLLAASLPTDAINLLQGEFAAGPQLDLDLGRLKPAMQLTGAIALVACLGWYGQWWSWHKEEKQLRDGMETAFVAAFPGTPLIVEPQLQLQSKLKSGTASPASDALARLVAAAPQLAGPGDAKLVRAEFGDGRLSVDYRGKPEQLAGLAQSLGKLGLVQTAPAGADRTRLTVTLNP
jgi:type II secretion system protein L